MQQKRPLKIIYPTILNVEHFHDIVIRQRGTTGYNSPGLVDVGIEWAKHNIEYYYPSPGLLLRAAALMFAYINFHAFNDGNKRTALLTTYFFFWFNSYVFEIKDDSADFTVGIAERWENLLPQPEPISEIERIAAWLRERTTLMPRGVGGMNRFIMQHIRLDEKGWEQVLKPLIGPAAKQIEKVSKKHRQIHPR